MRRVSFNTAASNNVTQSGIFRATVVSVGSDDLLSVRIPRLGLQNIYEDIPYAGPTPAAGDLVFVGFLEGKSGSFVAFTGVAYEGNTGDPAGDITSVVAGTNLNGGGSSGTVTVNLESDITLTSVTADDFYGDLHGAIHLQVKNVDSGALSQGDPVYATGAVGASGAIEVQGSSAGSAATMPAMGLLDQDLAVNGEGDVVVSGVLQNFDTDTPGYGVGDELYVAPSGGLTTTRPSGASELVQKIGKVIRVQQNTGEILVQGAGRTNDVPNGTLSNDISGNAATATSATTATLADDSNLLGGLGLQSASAVPSGSQVIRSRSNGYTYLGWLNTTSGSTTSTIDRIYASNDQFVRYVTPATFRSQVTDPHYLPLSGGTMTGELQLNARLDVGNGSNGNHEIRIYKADNNVADHIQFYNGTTRVGEIGCEDTTWLRINQETNKDIYTPRMIRADTGFQANDGSTSSPSYRFVNDTDTGMYRVTTNQVGFVTGGSLRGRFYSGGLLMGGASTGAAQIGTGTGSAGAPVYHFYGDTNTGMYRSGTDQISFSTAGSESVRIPSAGDLRMQREGIVLDVSQKSYWAINPITGTGNDAEWASAFGYYYLRRNSSVAADKVNIQTDLEGWLTPEMIDSVVPKMWARTETPTYPEIGPIADDMDLISPFLVTRGTDADGEVFMNGIDRNAYMSLLVLAVKDLRSQVATLTARLEALEAE